VLIEEDRLDDWNGGERSDDQCHCFHCAQLRLVQMSKCIKLGIAFEK